MPIHPIILRPALTQPHTTAQPPQNHAITPFPNPYLWVYFLSNLFIHMKQSPFKFQGNNSKQAKKQATNETEDKKGQSSLAPKSLKKTQSKAKTHIPIRAARPTMSQRPKGGG